MLVEKKMLPCCVCGQDDCSELYKDELADAVPPVDYDFTPETRKTYRIVRCSGCGHIYTNPMPFFRDVYEESDNSVYNKYHTQRVKTFTKIYDAVKSHGGAGRVLDIGCATGFLLDVFRSGFQTCGVEPSVWSRGKCSPVHDVRPSIGDFSGERFDVVTLLGVVEHLQHPEDMIAAISGMLRKGGLFLIYTGDVEALLPRFMGKKWWWYQGMHLHYFARRTMTKLLSVHGLDVVSHMNMPLYFSLESLGVSANRYDALKRIFSVLLSVPMLRDVTIPLPLSGEMLLFCRKT